MLFGYEKWANDRIFDAASAVVDARLEEKAGASFDSVRGNMAHILSAQITWYQRLSGRPVDGPHDGSMGGIRDELDESHVRWSSFVDSLSAADWWRIYPYRNSQGVEYERPLGLLLTHVVNHGTFHRGETGMLLAAYGASPGDLDIVYFFDEWKVPYGTR